MPTYLPIKLSNKSSHRARTTSRPKSRGHRAKPRSTTSSRARHIAGLKAARTRAKKHAIRVAAGKKAARTRARGHRAGRRKNLPRGFSFTKLARHSGRPGGRFQSGWEGVSKWKGPGKASSKRRKNSGGRRSGKIKYRTNTVVVHKTKRMRNSVGFDSGDSLRSLSTWGKVALGILFGLGGLVVAFGIPKGLAVASGKDAFQRGWGGVATAATATLVVGLGTMYVSKKAGLALLVAGGVGVILLAANALSPKAAQAVIPVNEATLAAMLPTFEESGRGPSDYLPGNFRSRTNEIPTHDPAMLEGGRGPSDYYPATRNTASSTVGNDASYYGSPLAPKERF